MVTTTRWETARRALAQAEASTGVRTRIRGATAAARPAVDLYPTAADERAPSGRGELMEAIRSGRASNISEAIEAVKADRSQQGSSARA